MPDAASRRLLEVLRRVRHLRLRGAARRRTIMSAIMLLAAEDGACGVLVFIGLIVGVIAFGIWRSHVVNRGRAANLKSLGDRWSGELIGGGLWTWARLRFHVDGVLGEVDYREGGRSSMWTRVRFQWASPRRLRVSPQGFSKWLRSLVGGGDIEVGDPVFDRKF